MLKVAVKTEAEANQKIAEIMASSFLSDDEKNSLCRQVLQALDYERGGTMPAFVKIAYHRMNELEEQVMKDESRPMGWAVTMAVIYYLAGQIDENGRLEVGKKEVAERYGMHMNNVHKLFKYLRKIGVLMDGKTAKKLAGKGGGDSNCNSPSYILCDKSLYFSLYLAAKFRSFQAELKRQILAIKKAEQRQPQRQLTFGRERPLAPSELRAQKEKGSFARL